MSQSFLQGAGSKADKNRQLLESDGIKLIDTNEIRDYGGDDLRQSFGADPNQAHNQMNESMNLLRELDKVRQERNELRTSKEKLQRDILNQTFESNLEMKEENQMLREQDVIRNELLTRYEKRNEDITKEVS